jgi:hypothetical protein
VRGVVAPFMWYTFPILFYLLLSVSLLRFIRNWKTLIQPALWMRDVSLLSVLSGPVQRIAWFEHEKVLLGMYYMWDRVGSPGG